MPFSGNTFTLPSGATTATPGAIVQSATWNNIHTDLNTGLTQLMSQLTTMNAFRNLLWMNGSFDVWQRGAGGTASIAQAASLTAYNADRWYLVTNANQASVVSQATGLINTSQFACKVLRNSGQTGIVGMQFAYPFDLDECVQVRGSIVTLTFVVKPGANWSPTNGTLTYTLFCGTGTAGKQSAGFTGQTSPITGTVNIAASGGNTSVSVNSSVVIPTTTTQMDLSFLWTPVGTAGVDDSFTIDDVQIEVDLSATTWTPNAFERIPFTVMLVGCQRHYQKTFAYTTAPAQGATLLNAISTISQGNIKIGAQWIFPVTMRTAPSFTTFNPSGATANWQDVTATASIAVTVDANSPSSKMIFITGATAAATDHLIYVHAVASAGL